MVRENSAFRKYMLKEYMQLMILDYLSTLSYAGKIVFIGGTNLRLVKGIDRFSEDLDFDCEGLSEDDFVGMTDQIVAFLRRSGLNVATRDRESSRLTAFRRSLYFPGLLYEMGLSGYKEERFLIKVEAQDQGYNYTPEVVNIKRAGFFFPFPVPSDGILCAMKISALLSRKKGRDFYDAMFLLSMTDPDYGYLGTKCEIHDREELKAALGRLVEETDLKTKSKDFNHLLFEEGGERKVLLFREFVETL